MIKCEFCGGKNIAFRDTGYYCRDCHTIEVLYGRRTCNKTYVKAKVKLEAEVEEWKVKVKKRVKAKVKFARAEAEEIAKRHT